MGGGEVRVCERRIEFFVKIQKKKNWGGGLGPGGGGWGYSYRSSVSCIGLGPIQLTSDL